MHGCLHDADVNDMDLLASFGSRLTFLVADHRFLSDRTCFGHQGCGVQLPDLSWTGTPSARPPASEDPPYESAAHLWSRLDCR